MTSLVVWLAGMPWEAQEGTDARLVRALVAEVPVLWVDPAASWLKSPLGRREPGAGDRRRPTAGDGAPGGVPVPGVPWLTRLTVVGPPGVTRPVARSIADRLLRGRVVSEVGRLGGASTVVLANPIGSFPRLADARRVYFVTDDWVAGAELMGLSRTLVEQRERVNVSAAHVVAAVSPDLADRLARRHGIPVHVLANGCTPPDGPLPAPADIGLPGRVAGMVGAVNERLELGLLEAVADVGVSVAVLGPRKDRDPAFGRRFEALVSRPRVRWVPGQPVSAVPAYLAAFAVGMTPYADTAFNRASFPLKTLEYLAAGLPCVSTRLPATDWLGTDLVDTASGPADFARLVLHRVERETHLDDSRRRIAFARGHSWSARARELLTMVDVHHEDHSAAARGPLAAIPGGTP